MMQEKKKERQGCVIMVKSIDSVVGDFFTFVTAVRPDSDTELLCPCSVRLSEIISFLENTSHYEKYSPFVPEQDPPAENQDAQNPPVSEHQEDDNDDDEEEEDQWEAPFDVNRRGVHNYLFSLRGGGDRTVVYSMWTYDDLLHMINGIRDRSSYFSHFVQEDTSDEEDDDDDDDDSDEYYLDYVTGSTADSSEISYSSEYTDESEESEEEEPPRRRLAASRGRPSRDPAPRAPAPAPQKRPTKRG
jgi:hypothetical protein